MVNVGSVTCKMTMDGENSDQSSPFNDSNSGNWLRCWDNEDRPELSSELDHLVEDKDIAARAVAFVVSSTRKGIVPLCADVASLFRSRRNLQTRLERLKLENRALRRAHTSTSTHTSVSTSPTPASPHSGSERCSCAHDGTHAHCSPCCSRCSSQCSSLTSDSPRLDKFSVRLQKSPRMTRLSAFSVPHDAVHTTHAAVHAPPVVVHRKPPASGQARKNSLPEIVCEPDNNVQKVSPRVSAEVESDLAEDGSTAELSSVDLRDRYHEVLAENKLLSGKLTSAQNEIDELRARLKRLEDRHSDSHAPSKESSGTIVICDSPNKRTPNKEHCINGVKPKVAVTRKRSPMSSMGQRCVSRPVIEYLEGCCCDRCCGVRQSGTDVAKCTQRELWLGGGRLEIGRQVALNDGQIGVVRYIGHVDNVSQPGTIYAGIELGSPVGRHNGCVAGKTYFVCDKDRGIFLPLEDLVHSIATQLPHEDRPPRTDVHVNNCTVECIENVTTCKTSTPGLPHSTSNIVSNTASHTMSNTSSNTTSNMTSNAASNADSDTTLNMASDVTTNATSNTTSSTTSNTASKPAVLPKRLFRVLDHTSRYVATGGCNLKLAKNTMHSQNQLV